jgi:hypothetical protein
MRPIPQQVGVHRVGFVAARQTARVQDRAGDQRGADFDAAGFAADLADAAEGSRLGLSCAAATGAAGHRGRQGRALRGFAAGAGG